MNIIEKKHGKMKITALMIVYGIVISAITPMLILVSEYLKDQLVYYYAITLIGFIIQVVLIIQLIRLWERGSHVIYHDEEADLLQMIRNIQGDLVSFNEYLDNFLKSKYSKEAKHEIYVSTYENDIKIGFSKIVFNKEARSGAPYYTVPVYAELILKKTDAIAPFFSLERRVLEKKDIKSLVTYGNVSLPGTMIFPLMNNERGVMGLWIIYLPDGKNIDFGNSPAAIVSSARFLLENILTIRHYKEKPIKSNISGQNQYLLMYNQIINMINVVVHEIQTPVSIINSYMMLIKHKGQITVPQINTLMEQTERISKRLTKMMMYANAMLPRAKDTQEPEAIKIQSVIDWLKDNYKSALSTLGNEKQIKVNLSVSKEIIQKEIANNSLMLQALYEILENAVLYAPPKTPITIKVGIQKSAERQSSVFFIFQNSGMIPIEVLENYRQMAATDDFKNHSSAERGAGFGFAMASMIISQMKGELNIKNETDHRVTIKVDLPLL